MPDSSASSSTGNATQYWVALLHATRPERLNEFVAQHAEAYHHAQPFPHASIDDIFPADVLRAISDEIPEVDAGTLRDERRTQADPQYLKRYIRDDTQMGVVTRLVFAVLRSPPFVDFLARLSGISGLLPDPVYAGSGVHITGVGGRLAVHADYNYHARARLARRVNAFVYLNHDWRDEYGGHLELWDRNLTGCRARLRPVFGRFVVFSTTDFTFHGHPAPLACPPNRARRSLALYYYTNGRPIGECAHVLTDGTCGSRDTDWRPDANSCRRARRRQHPSPSKDGRKRSPVGEG